MEQKRKVYEELNQFGIHYTIIEHPAVFTIDEMASLDVFRDNPWVVKNLFLRDAKGKRHFLVVMDKDKKADLKYIRKQLGTSTLSFASEDRLTKYLNLTKGSVTPFGIINDEEKAVEVVLDRSLVGREYIGVHPNENTATVMLSYRDLYKIIETHSNQIHIIDI
ncbi:MAG: YbaK/prolyl-tRNA synthetase associated region [Herbinix sp.]|nr:YbaK/prolyl-tRNA synthetase associated region [Herbinix sp.]